MASLHVFVCLLGLIVLGHSDGMCVFEPLKIPDPANPPKGCVDKDGKLHDFDTDWERDCTTCSCRHKGLNCCNMFPESGDIPPDCELVVNKATCSAKIVQTTDRTKDCIPL